MSRWCFFAALAAVLGCAPRQQNSHPLPGAAQTALEQAEKIEVLSLNPAEDEKYRADGFHGWPILGRTTVQDGPTRKALVAAVFEGVAHSDGTMYHCFEPRHGLRLTHDGKTYDFVICFECVQMEVYAGDGNRTGVATTGAAHATLDQILKDAGVPLAQKLK
jgi:hypothetical protein